MLHCTNAPMHYFHNSQFLLKNGLTVWQSCHMFLLGMKISTLEESQSHVNSVSFIPPCTSLHSQVCSVRGVFEFRKFHWTPLNACFNGNFYLRFQLTCFLRTEEIGGTTHHHNSNMQRCSMVRVTTSQCSAALGRAHTQKMVSCCVTLGYFRWSRSSRSTTDCCYDARLQCLLF